MATPSSTSLESLLLKLEDGRYRFGPGAAARILKLLAALGRRRFSDVPCLLRFHETLMFLRAFPQSPAVMKATDSMLSGLSQRVDALRQAGADMDEFDPLEVSGIAGITMQDTLSFDLARWLVSHLPGKVEIAWEDYAEERAMAAVWPRLMPLQADDGWVEADVPWRQWLETAGGGPSKALAWLVWQIEAWPGTDLDRARMYDSLRLPLRWKMENSRVSRTRNVQRVRSPFFHQEPLLARSEVSLATELARRPPELHRLSPANGAATMDLIREVMLVRYRELYGTTLGDARSVVRVDAGRGVSIYLWNLPPQRRLPLRAYVAGLTLKNGVPINYIEAIGLFEWVEVGFNTFYTFRGGEVAWIYAQVLRSLCHLMGSTCISMYPYQLGHGNDEAIDSGAYWFYRKLGFGPGREELLRLVTREEKKIAHDAKYRTPARTLRRLASGHLFYELPGSEPGAWNKFSTRNLGLKVNRRMARKFGGDAERMKAADGASLARGLAVNPSKLNEWERAALDDFAVMLESAGGVKHWSQAERDELLQIIRAKAAPDEMQYLHLMQQHGRLREAVRKLGSKPS